jgi:RNA-splicing ligase RtcB
MLPPWKHYEHQADVGVRGFGGSIAEEAPEAYKDVAAVVDAADAAGLARKVARTEPLVCVKG